MTIHDSSESPILSFLRLNISIVHLTLTLEVLKYDDVITENLHW